MPCVTRARGFLCEFPATRSLRSVSYTEQTVCTYSTYLAVPLKPQETLAAPVVQEQGWCYCTVLLYTAFSPWRDASNDLPRELVTCHIHSFIHSLLYPAGGQAAGLTSRISVPIFSFSCIHTDITIGSVPKPIPSRVFFRGTGSAHTSAPLHALHRPRVDSLRTRCRGLFLDQSFAFLGTEKPWHNGTRERYHGQPPATEDGS